MLEWYLAGAAVVLLAAAGLLVFARRRRPGGAEAFRRWCETDDWVVLDTETTRTGRRAEIIQIAVIDAGGRTLIDQTVDPAEPIKEKSREVHDIQDADVQRAPAWPEVHDRVAEVLNGRTVLAYNAPFDARVLRQTARRYRLSLPPIHWSCVMRAYASLAGEVDPSSTRTKYVTLAQAAKRDRCPT